MEQVQVPLHDSHKHGYHLIYRVRKQCASLACKPKLWILTPAQCLVHGTSFSCSSLFAFITEPCLRQLYNPAKHFKLLRQNIIPQFSELWRKMTVVLYKIYNNSFAYISYKTDIATLLIPFQYVGEKSDSVNFTTVLNKQECANQTDTLSLCKFTS